MSVTVLRKPGRRPIGPAVTFRVPEEIRDWVAAEAARRGLPDAEIWRELAAAEHARRCYPGGAA